MADKKTTHRIYKFSLWPGLIVLLVALLQVGAIYLMSKYLHFGLALVLDGENEIVLEYASEFEDPGATALFNGAQLDEPITVSGAVDTGELGEYILTYSVTYGSKTAQVKRTVRVVDTGFPQITLSYGEDVYTEPGCEYAEEGYSAWDAVDGDITERVVRVVDGETVTYTVSDLSGNTTSVQREILIDDRTEPELTLLGPSEMTIYVGQSYEEPGYSASDNTDGDLTANVQVSQNVDIYVSGIYYIDYTIADSWGNSAKLSRKVVVESPPRDESLPTVEELLEAGYTDTTFLDGVHLVNDPENAGDRIIYLTFDDGPGQYTPQLLAVLEKYNVQATFFVVGSSAMKYLDDIASQGHAIGAHSDSHNFRRIYSSQTAYFADLDALQDDIEDRIGYKTDLLRFPGGSSNTISRRYCTGIMTRLVSAVEEQGYTYFDWNVDSNDAGGAKTDVEVYNNVVSGISKLDVAVVLQHDIFEYSVNAVEKIIQWGLAHGYTFLPLHADSVECHHNVSN